MIPSPSSATQLNKNAMEALRLTKQPFDLPKSEELYVDATLSQQKELLLHNLEYSDMLQVLLGAEGSGKTSLIIRLLTEVPKQFELFVVRGAPEVTAAQIIRDILQSLGQRIPDDIDACIEDLMRHLQAITRQDTPAALIIDDADALSEETLEQLLSIINRTRDLLDGRLRVLLLAADMERKLTQLTHAKAEQSKLFVSPLRPFARNQTEAYLAHRLRIAGLRSAMPLNEKQIDYIHKLSGGLPARIDQVAVALLNATFRSKAKSRANKHRKRRILSLGAAAILSSSVILFVILSDEDTPSESEKEKELTIALPEPKNIERNAVPTRTVPSAQPASEPQPELEAQAGQGNERESEMEAEAQKQPIRAPQSVLAQKPDRLPQTAADRKSPTITTPAQVEQEPESNFPQTPDHVAPAQAPQQQDRVNASLNKLRNRQWLLTQRPDGYVVQLIALTNKLAFSDFVHQHPLETEAAYFKTLQNGKDWYVLVYGPFPDEENARRFIRELPPTLQRNSPWIRSLASVQQAIRSGTPE